MEEEEEWADFYISTYILICLSKIKKKEKRRIGKY